MGLFGSIGSAFRSVGRAFGRGVEKVGDALGSTWLSEKGRQIQDACAERVSVEKSYDKKEANIYTTDRLNEILMSFSEGYFQQATTMEKNCIRLAEEYYDKLIELVESVPEGAKSTANLKALKNGKKKIAKTISGGIKEPLAKRMSLDDSECLKILKMDAGVQKKEAMTRFSQKVISEALDNLAKNVRESLNEQTEDVQDYLNCISEEQKKAVQTLKEHFDKMVQDNDMEKSDREKNCIIPLYVVAASERIMDILK